MALSVDSETGATVPNREIEEIIANQFINSIYRTKETRLERYQSYGVDVEIPMEDKFKDKTE